MVNSSRRLFVFDAFSFPVYLCLYTFLVLLLLTGLILSVLFFWAKGIISVFALVIETALQVGE